MDCASAAALCKGPSLDVQNATTVLNDVRDLVADSSPQAIRDLDELIRLNLGVQEMLAVGTVSHTTDALLDTLKANRVLSDAQIVEAREQFAAATSGLAAARTGNAPAAQLAKDIVLSTASDGAKATADASGNISQSSDAATGLLSTQLAKDAKAYLTDIQNLTGRQFPPQQLEFLKADLGENTYSRLSKENVRLNRVEFNEKLPSLRAEWEKNTGELWPKESFIDRNGDRRTRNYDAHHVIENKFGGKAVWWNITPAMRGSEHQGGIHRPQGPAEKLLGK